MPYRSAQPSSRWVRPSTLELSQNGDDIVSIGDGGDNGNASDWYIVAEWDESLFDRLAAYTHAEPDLPDDQDDDL